MAPDLDIRTTPRHQTPVSVYRLRGVDTRGSLQWERIQFSMLVFDAGGVALSEDLRTRLAEMSVRGNGRPHDVRVALLDLAEVSQLRQD